MARPVEIIFRRNLGETGARYSRINWASLPEERRTHKDSTHEANVRTEPSGRLDYRPCHVTFVQRTLCP